MNTTSRVARASQAIALLLAVLGLSPEKAVAPADLLFQHGAVFTVDAARSWARAVAVRDGRIVLRWHRRGKRSLSRSEDPRRRSGRAHAPARLPRRACAPRRRGDGAGAMRPLAPRHEGGDLRGDPPVCRGSSHRHVDPRQRMGVADLPWRQPHAAGARRPRGRPPGLSRGGRRPLRLGQLEGAGDRGDHARYQGPEERAHRARRVGRAVGNAARGRQAPRGRARAEGHSRRLP